jgi:hypothetical protein
MPDRVRPLATPRNRFVDNFKMDIRTIKWGGTHWIYLAERERK